MFFKRKTDKTQFKEMAYPHMNFLYNVAKKYTENRFDAEDILQETYATAFEKFHQLRDKTKCKAWMFSILRRKFLRSLTAKKLMNQINLPDFETYIGMLETQIETKDPEQHLTSVMDSSILKDILGNLPEKHHTILLLFYMDELPYKEIASFLDIPVGTVMSRMTRVRAFLKKELIAHQKQIDRKGNIIDIKLKKIKSVNDKNK
jgi:RNA polymerase sigma-70 factor (ECF subfamily)